MWYWDELSICPGRVGRSGPPLFQAPQDASQYTLRMIRRIFVDNFRSLVDFEWKPSPEVLVLGANGSGKTALLDAIDVIRCWPWGWLRVEEMFDADAITRWSESKVVRFELDMDIGSVEYRYRLEFDCGSRDKVPKLKFEELSYGEKTILNRQNEAVSYIDSEGKQNHFPLPTSQSAVAALFAGQGAADAAPFLHALAQMIVVRPLPRLMENEAKRLETRAAYYFENFVAWYWNQAGTGKFPSVLFELLENVWPEFDYLKLEPLGRSMSLSAVYRGREPALPGLTLEFHELSEGERMLIALYALAAYQRLSPPTSIIIDEPDNFIALSELQPWLLRILDDRPDCGQIIVVSHNAEIVNTMGERRVALFERSDHMARTTVRTLDPDASGLGLSERITRGWLSTAPEQGIRG